MATMQEFLDALASKEPVPGGGGASALVGSVGAARCSMVANLTSGKKKYAQWQEDIERILEETARLQQRLQDLSLADEEAFLPLSAAYGMDKADPMRPQVMEKALKGATEVPLEMMRTLAKITPVLEELCQKGSRLAISDAAVAAAVCQAAMKGASMNVWINTKMMEDRAAAETYEAEADSLLSEHLPRCEQVYQTICKELRNGK